MQSWIFFILALVVFSGCSSRNFGSEKCIHIYKGDLQDRVSKFCDKYNRPPTSDEVEFQGLPLPAYFWYLSDYTDEKKSGYKVMIIDKETDEVIILRAGKTERAIP